MSRVLKPLFPSSPALPGDEKEVRRRGERESIFKDTDLLTLVSKPCNLVVKSASLHLSNISLGPILAAFQRI